VQERGLPRPLEKQSEVNRENARVRIRRLVSHVVIGGVSAECRRLLANPGASAREGVFLSEFRRAGIRSAKSRRMARVDARNSPAPACARAARIASTARTGGAHAEQHAKYLRASGTARGGIFRRINRFFTEDFRALRLFLYHAARENPS